MARAYAAVVAVCFLAFGALPAAVGQSSAPSAPSSRPTPLRAILTRGSVAVNGLPGFGRNALPGIAGEYVIAAAAAVGGDAAPAASPTADDSPLFSVRIWASKEPLYVSSADWRPVRIAGRPAFEATGSAGDTGVAGRLLLFDRPFVADGQGAEPRSWSVIIAAPADEARAADFARFMPVLLDRFSYFISSARAPSDVSFPAVLEIR